MKHLGWLIPRRFSIHGGDYSEDPFLQIPQVGFAFFLCLETKQASCLQILRAGFAFSSIWRPAGPVSTKPVGGIYIVPSFWKPSSPCFCQSHGQDLYFSSSARRPRRLLFTNPTGGICLFLRLETQQALLSQIPWAGFVFFLCLEIQQDDLYLSSVWRPSRPSQRLQRPCRPSGGGRKSLRPPLTRFSLPETRRVASQWKNIAELRIIAKNAFFLFL